jgi:hypothetical protein
VQEFRGVTTDRYVEELAAPLTWTIIDKLGGLEVKGSTIRYAPGAASPPYFA